MVNLEAEIKLNEYENVLGGYTGLLTFRLANLCVKSDPASLLVVSVDVFGKQNNIEDVSKVGVLSDEKMDVYPFHEDLLPMIGKAIAEVHPEFKQSLETLHSKSTDKDIRYLQLTMPEVDKNRRDLLMDGVDLNFNDCKAKCEAAKQKYLFELTDKMQGSSERDTNEAKERFNKMSDDNMKMAQAATDKKKKEIEEAYQRYLSKQADKNAAENEQKAAEGRDVSTSMKLPFGQ